MALQHLRSSTANKRPTPGAMSDGQLALNTNLASPGLFFKDSNGDSVKVGPVHVGTTAPNVTPGAGGQAGNSKGEQWLDTSSSRYVFKIWDGTAWRSEDGEFVNVSGDTMTGALGIIAGTAAAPGVFFSGDTNTGIYSPGADQVAVATNGVGRLFVADNGNVGVGTSPAVARINLSASGAGIPAIQFTDNANATGRIGTPSSGLVAFGGNTDHAIAFGGWASDNFTSERLRITSAGLVGIGTSAPSQTLHVSGGALANNWLVPSTTGYFYDSTGQNGIYIYGSTNGSTPNILSFNTNGTERLRVDASGRVGIGNSSPGGTLDIKAAASTHPLIVQGPSSEFARIDSNGDFLSGTTSNLAYGGRNIILKSGQGYAGIASLATESRIFSTWDTTAIPITFFQGGTERMRLDPSGRLGIGTSAPNTILDVLSGSSNSAGDSLTDQTFAVTGPNRAFSSHVGVLNVATNTAAGIDVGGSIGFGGRWSTNVQAGFALIKGAKETAGTSYASYLAFYTRPDNNPMSERLRIDSSGRLLVGTSTVTGFQTGVKHIFMDGGGASYSSVSIGNPGGAANNTDINLTAWTGSGSNYYTSKIRQVGDGSLVFHTQASSSANGAGSPTEQLRITADRYVRLASGTGGIQFGGDTAAANALDDYEEGTWTPAITGSTTAGTVQYYDQNGTYTKIGRVVFITVNLIWLNGTGTGDLRISGLPFTGGGGYGVPNTLSMGYVASLSASAGTFPSAAVNNGNAYISIREQKMTPPYDDFASAPPNLAYDGQGKLDIHGFYLVS